MLAMREQLACEQRDGSGGSGEDIVPESPWLGRGPMSFEPERCRRQELVVLARGEAERRSNPDHDGLDLPPLTSHPNVLLAAPTPTNTIRAPESLICWEISASSSAVILLNGGLTV